MKPYIVIPTYQEAPTLSGILEKILQVTPRFEVLIVDDNSPDGTGQIADALAAKYPTIQVLHRPAKTGLGSAYVSGFRRALEQGANPVFEMDADHSHNPKYLPALPEKVRTDADVAIGSRYLDGVRVENWPFRRLMVSRFANRFANLATGLPPHVVSDLTSGFRAYRREVLEAIGLDTVRSNGYSFQIEMAYRAWRLGFRVCEVPIMFEEHYLSSSKFSRAIMWEAILRTPLLRFTAPRGRQKPQAGESVSRRKCS